MTWFSWEMWIIVGVILAIGEIASTSFVLLWFALGSLVGALVAFLGASPQVQLLSFGFASLVLVLFTRPLSRRFFKSQHTATNMEALVGTEALVTETIDNIEGTGLIKIYGQEWPARSVDNTLIEKGNMVIIKAVTGVRLLVQIKEGD